MKKRYLTQTKLNLGKQKAKDRSDWKILNSLISMENPIRNHHDISINTDFAMDFQRKYDKNFRNFNKVREKVKDCTKRERTVIRSLSLRRLTWRSDLGLINGHSAVFDFLLLSFFFRSAIFLFINKLWLFSNFLSL